MLIINEAQHGTKKIFVPHNIENELHMCEGARVLLTQNLWVEAGLMNGALGTVRGSPNETSAGRPQAPSAEKIRKAAKVFMPSD